jgi:homoaconitase/3-isopropylmalate dehydratase large subunit
LWKERFRRREETAIRQEAETEQRTMIMEYEYFREHTAQKAFEDLSEEHRRVLRREKTALLKQQDRFDRLPPEMRDREVDDLILKDLAQSEAPPFEKWYLRRRAQQAMLPFEATEAVVV